MQRIFLFAILILALSSCFDKPLPPTTDIVACNEPNRSAIIGTWETDWMIVRIDTINNSETSVVVEITPSDWGDKVKTLPARCRFNDDGTYVSWIYDTDHRLIRKCIGHWNMNAQFLAIEQQYPSARNMVWQVNIPKSSKYAEFFSKYDFDGDGKSDDNIYCQMKRISPASI